MDDYIELLHQATGSAPRTGAAEKKLDGMKVGEKKENHVGTPSR
jgi:hypothetical protein